ncbi:MAG: hypothetical protein A2Y14_01450 [Verrucomicrobia bacterium GWF2_51_19]|nr:MAG: hypothetical protein A2Y14_01450 [Verrucomicrobia bacterium GWF2_51_19]HCJ12543.1 hypothetical protein [Opitutae bacterium]
MISKNPYSYKDTLFQKVKNKTVEKLRQNAFRAAPSSSRTSMYATALVLAQSHIFASILHRSCT